MSDHSAPELRQVRRRLPAVLLLFALAALLVSVCHGSHGHTLPATGTPTVSAPGLPHGCDRPDERWTFDAHLPAQAAPQPAAPDAAGAVPLAHRIVPPAAPHLRCVRGRAGPGPEPGRLLIALGVDRN
ncbi:MULTISPECIES: hypothetical protein [Streptomyces]|uniref:Secreted protein n=1 Tax=Streptomyces solicathayae TaxID=3081768 RepID=A0ABZ0LVE6_9ACTN|nr:hypothetical protein [Streptomyces sp. HUAS YS2]WOX23472.1 hypothetical protein R2D22_19610 [Streptomyces sp. HUAS YS2]